MLVLMITTIPLVLHAAIESGGAGPAIVAESGGYVLRAEDETWLHFDAPALNGQEPEVSSTPVENGWVRIHMVWDVGETVQQDELAVRFDLEIEPDFWWAPHLTPEEGNCIAQHVFRSPALIAASGARTLAIVLDLDLCGRDSRAPWFMDFDAPKRTCWLGLSRSQVISHVQFAKAPGMELGPGRVELGFFVTAYEDPGEPRNPWERVSSFLWERYGRQLLAKGEPGTTPLDTYVDHTYEWAFGRWKDSVWQEFDIGEKHVGAPAFIVTVTQSPNYPGEPDLREALSIWNQAWFSSLRSATGLFRYGRRTGQDEYIEKARLSLELALAAPMNDGIFPAVYRTKMTVEDVDGQKVRRTEGWDTGYWCNSNRVPWERGITDQWYHILDASWTCLLMLRWHADIEADQRLVDYARTYAEKLLSLQDDRGFFPAWLDPESLAPSPILSDSPETSMSVTFLLELAKVTKDERFRDAAMKAMDAVITEVIPAGRWEDYETYWSCCGWGKDEFLGKRIPRNAMYKQNTLSMFWTAEALLECYRATGNERYLKWGRRTLDELSMAQQVWQPPFIYIPALGGFGVMNFDGEWNDARQSLFCELFLEYYKETGEPNLFERGIAALKASFVMMYCPENAQVRELWEKVHSFFGPEDFGFMMENYGHGGTTGPGGDGIGPFTIYDWGNGAASEARNRVRDHFGDVYIDRTRRQGFGIDSVAVSMEDGTCAIADQAKHPRTIRVVFEDGTSTDVALDGKATVEF
jgi:hypothetical protein